MTSRPNQQTDEDIKTRERAQIKKPPLFKVLLHNDDYTTMEFVVYLLIAIFRHSEIDAIKIMLEVHHLGVGVAGIFSYEIAETKVSQASALAREHQFPLLCTMEEA
ncbi:MAG: ATP-dependent Clp protease adaptor ClpS [Acidobacteria bacterium]|nr:ATP-dependent Clp protease adaptor ClpS [Acidobacteriota bacterium]